jgi:hypothetical protein
MTARQRVDARSIAKDAIRSGGYDDDGRTGVKSGNVRKILWTWPRVQSMPSEHCLPGRAMCTENSERCAEDR